MTWRRSGRGPKKWSANDRWLLAMIAGPMRGTFSRPSDHGRNTTFSSRPSVSCASLYPTFKWSHELTVFAPSAMRRANVTCDHA
jgi:hypothetical protein